jgi:hypothetical protein
LRRICAICIKNKPTISGNLTVVSQVAEEYHHKRDIVGKEECEGPRNLYKMYKYILSEKASCARIGYRIYVEGEQQI